MQTKQNKTEVCQVVLTAVNILNGLKSLASILLRLALTSKGFFTHSCQHLHRKMKEEALMRKKNEVTGEKKADRSRMPSAMPDA